MLFIFFHLCCLHINCHLSVNIICNLPLLGGADISIIIMLVLSQHLLFVSMYNICTFFRIKTCLN